ncbi:MAG: transposase [Syntrophobacteraceae bacterium]|jgi:transposase-like protein
MAKKPRSFNAQFKFKAALEAVKEGKTLNELASEHGARPNRITRWKQQLLKEGSGIFSRNAQP